MRAASRYLIWLTAALMLLAWLLHWDDMEAFAFQRDRNFRNISGAVVLTLILVQWTLTLGRTVFQRSGSQWGNWINWHLRVSLLLPQAVLAHAIATALAWADVGASDAAPSDWKRPRRAVVRFFTVIGEVGTGVAMMLSMQRSPKQ